MDVHIPDGHGTWKLISAIDILDGPDIPDGPDVPDRFDVPDEGCTIMQSSRLAHSDTFASEPRWGQKSTVGIIAKNSTAWRCRVICVRYVCGGGCCVLSTQLNPPRGSNRAQQEKYADEAGKS